MSKSFMRQVTDALMPSGAIWNPAFGSDFDRLLDGVSESQQAALNDLENLAYTRDPYRCPIDILPDLEREFGIAPNTNLPEQTRRSLLASVRYKRTSLATAEKLQRALDKAGFGEGGYGLTVTPNSSPPVEPLAIIDRVFAMTAHEFPSGYCTGNKRAYCGYISGYYLVSGDRFVTRALYPQAGNICARAFDGSDSKSKIECAGHYTKTYSRNEESEYTSPAMPYWPLLFFIGGPVNRNADGSIIGIASITIPANLRQSLHRTILRIKPVGVWAAMMVRYQ